MPPAPITLSPQTGAIAAVTLTLPAWWRPLLALLLVLLLAGCDRESRSASPAPVRELVFYSWAEDLPPSLLEAFTAETGVKVVYRTYQATEEAVRSIRSGSVYDVAVIENQFIPELATDGLLAELDHRSIPNLAHLSENFRELVFDPGNRYSVTFNWGLTGLVVRDDLTPGQVTRWADLWDERFAGRI
ncbi:MAG: extracellular solute-binding protein, partial [Proteobacteria bacterium]|nr:extracellular solute-binding protein [Pseudomonadota bacterium]